MRHTLLFITTLTFIISCNSNDTPKPIVTADSMITYPSSSIICFDKNGERKRGIRQIKLGDSLTKIISFLDLEISAIDSVLKFESKKPFIKKGKHGLCEIYIVADFDKNKLMKSFKAVWIYKGDKSDASRVEFWNMILAYSMTCLWEESLNLYKEKDTISTFYFNNQVNQFTTELRNNMWLAKYEAYMR